MLNKIIFSILFICAITCETKAQRAGSITFERRTNLYKRFTDPEMKKWIKAEDQYKVETFVLKFNDTCSLFSVQESDGPDYMNWVTQRHITYTSLPTQTIKRRMDAQADIFSVIDSVKSPKWKITGIKREIAGYVCYKAFYAKNDSLNIYAWFSPDLPVSVGPEGYTGLPGTILGVAAENGGEIYFAQEVTLVPPKPEELVIEKLKGKIYTNKTLVSTLKESLGAGMKEADFGMYMLWFFGI
jgi:GLPGLI family protein